MSVTTPVLEIATQFQQRCWVSSFPATLAARVHGVFFLSADGCSDDSREDLCPDQFGEGSFGRFAASGGRLQSTEVLCPPSQGASLLRGFQVDKFCWGSKLLY